VLLVHSVHEINFTAELSESSRELLDILYQLTRACERWIVIAPMYPGLRYTNTWRAKISIIPLAWFVLTLQ